VGAISPDGTLLATCTEDSLLCIINIATQAKVYTVKFDDDVCAAFCSLLF